MALAEAAEGSANPNVMLDELRLVTPTAGK